MSAPLAHMLAVFKSLAKSTQVLFYRAAKNTLGVFFVCAR